MAEVSTFRCDECGKLKEQANHWYRAMQPDGKRRFVIVAFEDCNFSAFQELAEDQDVRDFCGMGCAVKAMTKAMEQSG
jgi:hypothetical protein